MRLALLLLSTLVLAGCAQSANQNQQENFEVAPALGTLRGVVVDDAIRPLSNASVTVDGQDPPLNGTTDAQGQFVFTNLPPGAYVVRAAKVGYFEAQVAATVLSEGESPSLRITLSIDVALAPAVSTFTFNGFLKCSVTMVAIRYAACNPNESLSPVCALPLGFCNFGPQNVTDDQFMALHRLDRAGISFLQSEMQWKDTSQGFGKNLRAIPGARSPGDGKIGDFHAFEGPAPLVMSMPGSLANALLLGNGRDYIVRVFASQMDGTAPPCLQPPINCQWGIGLVVNQQFDLFTHVFYNSAPPEGWQFGRDGDPNL